MKKTADLHWLAGLLEGEGCFSLANGSYLTICLQMTDRDVVERARDIMAFSNSVGVRENGEDRKISYTFQLVGKRAVQWMMTLYSLMGVRRRTRIRELLQIWKPHHV